MTYELKYISDNGHTINFGPGHGFVVGQIREMGAVPVEVITAQGINRVGGVVQAENVQTKNVQITGNILGLAEGRRKQLIDAIVPQVGGRLIYNNRWVLYVRPSLTPAIENMQYSPGFRFSVRAANPLWLSTDERNVSISGVKAQFQYPVNYGDPPLHMFGQYTPEAAINAFNSGSMPVHFKLIFRAVTALKEPVLINAVTGDFIKINTAMVAGEIIEVDMTTSPMLVTSTIGGVRTNIFGRLDLDSFPFRLQPGDNVLQRDALENPEGLRCMVLFREATPAPY